MIIDALVCLSRQGFDIAEYQYTGMGALHFVDFILFHRILGIQKMLSAEYSTSIRRRVLFNKPYKCIDVVFKAIGDVIPDLDPDLRHILWLDYDFKMNSIITADVTNAAASLSVGSFLLITVDAEPPIEGAKGKPQTWRKYFLDECGMNCNPGWPRSDYRQSNLHTINVRILENALLSGLAGRANVAFLPLFNFSYADGHEMLTIGGIIGANSEKARIDACNFQNAVYLRRDLKKREYRIPKFILTRKEKLYLDADMPNVKRWRPRHLSLDQSVVDNYCDVYRFYPSYAELLL